MKDNLRVISLFSGYGTQELALNYANILYENIANCDILSMANIAYDSLHTTKLGNLGDVENDITDIYLTNNGSAYKTLPSVSVSTNAPILS